MSTGTHQEKISPGSFDGKFKNLMRDYYHYGFLSAREYDDRKNSTHLEDWNRLNRLLRPYFTWSVYDRNTVLFASCDSQDVADNPFHHVYRFCRYTQRDPQVFFNILFALSGKPGLRNVPLNGEVSSRNSELLMESLGLDLNSELKRRALYSYLKRIEDGTFRASAVPDTYPVDRSDKQLLIFINKVVGFVHTHNRCKLSFNDSSSPLPYDCNLTGEKDGEYESIAIENNAQEELAETIVRASGSLHECRKYIADHIVINKLLVEFQNLYQSIGNHTGLTRSQLQCFVPNDKALFVGKNEALKSPLQKLEFLRLIQNNTDRSPGRTVRENRYALQDATMNILIQTGRSIDQDFINHLRAALEFFSRYYCFGECGIYLLDRLGPEKNHRTPFRFKHDYLMHALNDFNRKDLLDAIEQKKWCRIEYKRAAGSTLSTELLCMPLEIRSSVVNGREFLIFYEPQHRSYTSLRLEFIDAIYLYDDQKVKDTLDNCLGLKPTYIESDILNAKRSLLYVWGVSTTPDQEGNAIKETIPTTVRLLIKYDPSEEYYIYNRIYRESRLDNRLTYLENNSALFRDVLSDSDYYNAHNGIFEHDGLLELRIQVTDPHEMIPWIRSFYSRIMEYTEDSGCSLEEDVREINRRYKEPWGLSAGIKKELGKGLEARGHEQIFHEMFGTYYYMTADFLSRIFKESKRSLSQEVLDKLAMDSISCHYDKSGESTSELIKNELDDLCLNESFGKYSSDSGFIPRYSFDAKTNIYRDIIPLSEMELRWLKTIINEPRFAAFFKNTGEVSAIETFLEENAPEIEPLPTARIVYYDRYQLSTKGMNLENKYLGPLSECIRNRISVNITYLTRYKKTVTAVFDPAVIEYSCRNNNLQLYARSHRNGKVSLINLSRIQNLSPSVQKYDYQTAMDCYKKYREDNKRSVEILFYNEKNNADRILTEFAPWDKRCTLDRNRDLFNLKIFYQSIDETDIVTRLMGYGSAIRFADPDHDIAKEMQTRIGRQADIFRELRHELIRTTQNWKNDPEIHEH